MAKVTFAVLSGDCMTGNFIEFYTVRDFLMARFTDTVSRNIFADDCFLNSTLSLLNSGLVVSI